MGKVSLEQTDTKRSVSTLVRICTGSKVGVDHFRNSIERNIRSTTVVHKLEKMHKWRHVITVSNSEASKDWKDYSATFDCIGGFSVAVLKLLIFVLRADLETYALLERCIARYLRAPVSEFRILCNLPMAWEEQNHFLTNISVTGYL